MGGCMGGLMDGVVSNLKNISKKSLPRYNSFLFENVWFVETPPPMGGCMGHLMDGTFFTNYIAVSLHPTGMHSCLTFFDFLLEPPQPLTGLFYFIMSTLYKQMQEGSLQVCTPRGPNLHDNRIIFKIMGLHTNFGSWRPHLREILDQPLYCEVIKAVLQIVTLGSV